MAAISPSTAARTEQRPCAVATASGAFSTPTPCPNGPGQLQVKTNVLPEGTQQLAVQAQDTAGNLGTSPPITARIDNTPPGRVDVTVQGGEQWRNTNDFVAAWTNPAEDDRAPIVSVTSKLCAADGTRCTQGDTAGDGIASLPVEVPGPGEWTVSLWRHDAAGNVDQTAASVPVTLRYDPEPPQLSFDTPSQGDPTLLSVPVVDKVSGVADGSIEISAAGSDTWQTLKTDIDGDHLVARVDDAALPAGPYAVRATAHDHAGNEASTSQRTDGQPMTLTLPIRIVSAASAGVLGVRIERTVIKKKHGRRSVKVTRVPELKPTDSVRLGQQAQVIGRLCNRDGQGIANATLDVLETSALAPEHLIGQVSTDANGGFSYTATGTTSRTLHFVYGGSAVVLPSDARVELTTPAESTLGVDRARVLNGQSVTFSGHVASGPIPAGGKLVQLEVRLSHRWQTFRTVRTDAAGNWAVPYRFARTRGIAWYRFRVELPPEAGYPFTAGASKSIRVRVRGRR